jgi:ATP-dependent Clp protease adapter protein ClpS
MIETVLNMESLMKICDHEYEQAAQCASIVHNSGKCDVKYGDVDTISTMKDKLKSLGYQLLWRLYLIRKNWSFNIIINIYFKIR